jgi:superfamily II DNA/RNA helicase
VPQNLRERTIERLRDGRVDVLVATDVAARGLDVERISLVINYDIPFDGEAYVHRIGRTGRAGRSGDAILFLTPRERRFLGGLERATGQPIEPMEVPSNATINQHRLDLMRQRLTERLESPSGSDEERALMAEILQRVTQEQNCSGEALALAALQLSLRGKPLVQPPLGIAETAGKRVVGHDAQAHLVRNDHDRGRAGGQRGQQPVRFRLQVVIRQQVIGQPQRRAIHQNGGIGRNRSQTACQIKRRFAGFPAPAPAVAVRSYPVPHFIVPGFCGCDVNPVPSGSTDQSFSKCRFSGTGPAQHTGEFPHLR